MNVSDIVTEFGAYYLNSGQNMTRLYQQLRRDFATKQAFTTVITDDTVWRASNVTHRRVVQPFQKAFTPSGAVTFEAKEIRQYHQKIDVSEYPDDLEDTWLGFLADHNVSRKEWPFIKWWLEKQVVPQAQQDIEINEIGIGAYAAPTPGTAGAISTSMNGILTIINAGITASEITPFVLGAIGANDADKVTYAEAFHKALPKAYRNIPMTLYCSEDFELGYKRGYGDKYGLRTTVTAGEESSLNVKHTNLTVKGLPSLNFKVNGSTANDRIFATPKGNAIMLQKKTENMNRFDLQSLDRQVKALTDWYMGVGFIDHGIVFTNDGA